MADVNDYGNWMNYPQGKGKKPAGRRGIANESDDEDDYENVVLEDMRRPTPPPLPRAKKVKAAASNKGNKRAAGTGESQVPHSTGPSTTRCEPPKTGPAIAVISGDSALWPPKLGLDLSSAAVVSAFHPPGGDLPLPTPVLGKRSPGRSMLITYVLLGLCFLMCIVFLTLALMKRSEPQQESEELNTHLPQKAANASQQPTEIRQQKAKQQMEIVALWNAIGAVNFSLAAEMAAMRDFRISIQAQIMELQKKIDSVCGKCPPGWKWFQSSCYFFSESTKTWSDAKKWCLGYGSQLVIVNSKEEQAFLVKSRVTSRVYWLGMSDQKVEGEWYWVDGSRVTLSFWSSGEPNDQWNNEDCGTITIDGRWNDISCSHTDYWICKKPWLC